MISSQKILKQLRKVDCRSSKMNIEKVKKDIEKWIIEFLEVPHSELGNLPACPYARSARINQEYEVRIGNDLYSDLVSLSISGMENWKVIILAYKPSQYLPDVFSDIVNKANQECLLKNDMIALEDHPDAPEIVNGISMNQGTYAMAMVQSLSELNEKASLMAKTGFYDGWPEEYLHQVFKHRIDPRQP